MSTKFMPGKSFRVPSETKTTRPTSARRPGLFVIELGPTLELVEPEVRAAVIPHRLPEVIPPAGFVERRVGHVRRRPHVGCPLGLWPLRAVGRPVVVGEV